MSNKGFHFRKIVERRERVKVLRSGNQIYFFEDVLECGHIKRVRTDPATASGQHKRLCRFCKKEDK